MKTFLKPENLKELRERALLDHQAHRQNKRKIKLTLDDEKWNLYSTVIEINTEDKTNVIVNILKERLGFLENLEIYGIDRETKERIPLKESEFIKVAGLIKELEEKTVYSEGMVELFFNFESTRTDPIYLTT